ncbi:5-amino-6-(5-phosphoribosylamino)uracil reductase [Haloarcula hispanica N601]|uniref:2,5-diamino-6-(ribosylamino)-4(3H)-pyrimidinone 5'-phosphate reductase n=3 Tax=Haloarcula hispanica TaxID=51589 RepID=A0A482T5I2_HALHI|nr:MULTISPECIES: 2,5-diamino-6-(ribosylamino)-4(3H)-pyrimidinone 5'-phosphate reductase [Haloarcula]AEM57340.1 2,5-diamino-6-hydroxy-4-(5-phosphoribosylamino)pyrimidine1-reductase [Haloarcula hispanica ATCC 33960]AHB66106.1 5-amino-6-(5-phosphoribosylamino)uracil reductase [Haloarcula hispanica N601]AJF27236.1 5-amino-6-(5-phosphoribosylamino)uracil reductase [Haloarcula sp. CBA1115]KAA9406954.1 2,5-diamino-6-(ribosylamino)-4(3H)-pyrimidinone 5'-phosphate reductase [Haloarcula sp. CBA1131]KAA9
MHVVVNAAMSVDGKLSSRRREQIAISGPDDFDRVDQLRADSDAVMVGVGTILADDPSLTVDDADRRAARADRGKPENPARVVADSRIRTPPDATVLDGRAQTYLLVSEAAPPDFIEEMEDAGAYVIAAGQDRVDLTTTLAKLEGDGIDQLMVEGGGELIFGLLEEALVDELFVYIGPKVIGGRDAPTLADGDGFIEDFPEPELAGVERLDDGVVLHWQF